MRKRCAQPVSALQGQLSHLGLTPGLQTFTLCCREGTWASLGMRVYHKLFEENVVLFMIP